MKTLQELLPEGVVTLLSAKTAGTLIIFLFFH